MKARHQFRAAQPMRATDGAKLYRPESAPNSSTILAVTVLGSMADVLAVIRTAALLGKSFKAVISINVLGHSFLRIGPDEDVIPESLARMLERIERRLNSLAHPKASVFALEVSITAASFLAAGTISVHVRGTESPASKRAAMTR